MSIFEEDVKTAELLAICYNIKPQDVKACIADLEEYRNWEGIVLRENEEIRSTLYENMTENITRAFADIIHPEHISVKYATIDADVTDAITYSVYEDEPGRFHLLFYHERIISETEKGCKLVGVCLGLTLKGLRMRLGADWTEVRNWSGTVTDSEMLADISPIVATKCKLVDVTFLQSGDLVRRVMYCIMSEQVRDSYEKI